MGQCEKCLNPLPCCYCSELPTEPLENVIRFVILQDPYELSPSKLKLSSVPILKHVLNNCTSFVLNKDNNWRISEDINHESCVVLYPSESSMTIPEYLQTHQIPQTVIVLDGSWVTVQESLHRMPFLHPKRINHIRISPLQLQNRVSLYHSLGLRKEPARNCISTAEAVALALHSFDPCHAAVSFILNTFHLFVEKRIQMTNSVPVLTLSGEFFPSEVEEMLFSDRGLKEKKKVTKVQSRAKQRIKEKKKKKHR
jgi:DTW domain-containing protein YfiP